MLAGALVAATFFWLGRRDIAVSGPPELIHAPPGPYKVRPPNPGGLNISAESETAFETSAGEDKDAQLDTSKLTQAPVPKAPDDLKKPADEAKKPVIVAQEAKSPTASAAEPAQPKPTGGTGSVIQLGAFAKHRRVEQDVRAVP
jgi:hypothetical protein